MYREEESSGEQGRGKEDKEIHTRGSALVRAGQRGPGRAAGQGAKQSICIKIPS